MFKNSSSRLQRMRLMLVPLAAVALAVAMVSYAQGNGDEKSIVQPQTVSIPVDGMSCVSCAARVKRALKKIEGVQEVEVSLERREAVVRYQRDKVSPDRLRSVIDALGYKAGTPRVAERK